MTLWLENLRALPHQFLQLSSNFFLKFLLRHKHLYSIKSSLTFDYSKQHSHSLYLIPHVSLFLPTPCLRLISWIPVARLLKRFDNKLAIDLALSINYLRQTDNACYTGTGFVDSEDNSRIFTDGQWRNLVDWSMLRDINSVHNAKYHRAEFEAWKILADCLFTKNRSVLLQLHYIRRTGQTLTN